MTINPAPDLRLQIDRIKRLSLARKSLYAVLGLAFVIVCAAVWPESSATTPLSAVSLLVTGLVAVRAANRSLGYRFGTRLGWSRHRLVLVGLGCGAAGLAFEPVRTAFEHGEISIVLMAVLLLDLLGYTPRLIRGALVGIAAGLSLTPVLFIALLAMSRRYREAALAAGATVATMIVGWLTMPGQTVGFFTGDIINPGTAEPVANQSVRGVFTRVIGDTTLTGMLWPVGAAIACGLGLLAARRADDRGFGFEAILLVAATATLASPVSWTGAFVFALPTTIALAGWVYRTRGPVRHLVVAVGLFWKVTLTAGLVWLAPRSGDPESLHDGLALVLGNSYAIAAIALVTTALILTWPQEPDGYGVRASRIRLSPSSPPKS